MKKKIIFIAVFISIGIGVLIFHQLGGFNDVLMETTDMENIDLSGSLFKGRPDDPKLAEAFQEIEKLKFENPEASLFTIYYTEPAGKRDTMEVFVGVESKWLKSKSGYDRVSFSGQGVVIASIKAHRFVMPGPLKIKNKMIQFAKENELPTPKIFIDQIIDVDEVKVYGTSTLIPPTTIDTP